jgi:hypothetical protein
VTGRFDRLREFFGRGKAAPKREEDIVYRLLVFLDGRRVLFDPITVEEPSLVAESVLLMRERLDKDLESLAPDAAATPVLRDMRRACLEYLTRVPNPSVFKREWPHAINDLRKDVADGVEALETAYGVSMPGGVGRETRVINVQPPPRFRNPER